MTYGGHWIGLKGITTTHKKGAIKGLVYESRAQMKDHKTDNKDQVFSSFGT